MKSLNWKEYFMALAQMTALRSKDPNTKVGAVLVNQKQRIIATGYNGMPQGDDSFSWSRNGVLDKNTKYPYVIHAEVNAILNATTPVSGATAYLTLFPCFNCAKILAHSEIKEIYYIDDKYHDTNDAEIARFILDKTKVIYRQLTRITINL